MKSINNTLVKFLISESTVITVITLNALIMFLDAFPAISVITNGRLFWIDYVCVIYFIIEAFLKIIYLDCEEYWDNNWNRFDFFVVISSAPTLLEPFFDVKIFTAVLILRLGRLARFFKLLRFVPDGPKIWLGVKRALKASIAVFLALLLLNIIFGMGATILFSAIAPEHFANPLISCYTMFKVFTIEGWHEIPDEISSRADIDASVSFVIRLYFITAVIIGGILGLSMANAVFVDEMTADNTQTLEKMVKTLQEEIYNFKKENLENREKANETIIQEIETIKKILEKK